MIFTDTPSERDIAMAEIIRHLSRQDDVFVVDFAASLREQLEPPKPKLRIVQSKTIKAVTA